MCHTAPTHVLEASVERLQLFPGELCLSLQLVQTLRLVPHRGELQVAVATVCEGQRQKHTQAERERDGQTGSEEKGGSTGKKQRERERGWERRDGGQMLSAQMQVREKREEGSQGHTFNSEQVKVGKKKGPGEFNH